MTQKEGRMSLTPPATVQTEDDRTGTSPETLARAILDNLYYLQGRIPELASRNDWYMAAAYTVRDRLVQRWIQTIRSLRRQEVRVVSYLSAEFLMGPHLANALESLGIREEVGEENFFLFGLNAEEVISLKSGGYNPRERYESDAELREALDQIGSGFFSGGDGDLFKPLVDSLLSHDDYLLLADYRSYIDCQDRMGKAYSDEANWTRMSILNVARMGKFSSDRSIREYCEQIWKVEPVKVEIE